MTYRHAYTVPEMVAREAAPYAIIMEYCDPNGVPYTLVYQHFDLRGIEATLRRIRDGEVLRSPDWRVRRVFLAYNLLELPVPIAGIPGGR